MMADKETFCSSRQQDVGTGLIDRVARSAQTLDGERQLVKRRRWITGRIFDRQARDAGSDAAGDIIGHIFRGRSVARREVRIDRNIDRARNIGYVCQVTLTSERTFGVRQSLRERKARAGRRQRRESELLQVPRRADIPWIRNHETACLVQSAERPATGSEVLYRFPTFHSDTVRCHSWFELVHRMLQSLD